MEVHFLIFTSPVSCMHWAGFLSLGTIGIWGRTILVLEAVLYTVGCLAAPLVSTH